MVSIWCEWFIFSFLISLFLSDFICKTNFCFSPFSAADFMEFLFLVNFWCSFVCWICLNGDVFKFGSLVFQISITSLLGGFVLENGNTMTFLVTCYVFLSSLFFWAGWRFFSFLAMWHMDHVSHVQDGDRIQQWPQWSKAAKATPRTCSSS